MRDTKPAKRAGTGSDGARTSRGISKASARDLERLIQALAVLARELPERTTLRQAVAFLIVAYSDAMGTAISLKRLQEVAGETADGTPLVGRHPERILDIF